MARSRNKVPAHARHKKIIKAAKGFQGRRKNTFSNASAAVWQAGQYAYVGRKKKKRTFRSLWIQRISGSSASMRLSARLTKTSPIPA